MLREQTAARCGLVQYVQTSITQPGPRPGRLSCSKRPSALRARHRSAQAPHFQPGIGGGSEPGSRPRCPEWGKAESVWHHSDYAVGLAIQLHGAAKHTPVSAKSLLPQSVTENNHPVLSWLGFLSAEVSA